MRTVARRHIEVKHAHNVWMLQTGNRASLVQKAGSIVSLDTGMQYLNGSL